ncbi:MAG: hypothetical protein JSV41_09650 [Gemmatimonadota bacterium]|nr:MAG: hypothetical protein JSV41_09650 [Gemmatimonadota bacterium]
MLTGVIGSTGIRRSLALVLTLAVLAGPEMAEAQALKKNRRWLFAVGAAIAVGVSAYSFNEGSSVNSVCTSKACVGIVAGIMGGTVGFLIGSELDSRYSRRMAAGPSLEYEFQNVPLGLVPDRMSGFASGAAVVGLGGARVVLRDGTVLSRGARVRGIEDSAVLPALDLLVLSTFSNLIGFPLEDDSAQGQVIDERGGGTMEVFAGQLAVAGADSLRLLQVGRQEDEIFLERLGAFEQTDFVTDMTFSDFGRIGWLLVEDRLSSYSPGLERLGEVVLPASGRTVRAAGSRLAVAAGSRGVFLLDAADPTAPRVVSEYTGVRFAYAADLAGDLLYVAAGPEGMAVVDVSGSEPRVVGVAREVRFVTDVVVDDSGAVWILDRDGQRVQIAELDLQHVAGATDPAR